LPPTLDALWTLPCAGRKARRRSSKRPKLPASASFYRVPPPK
jgi:hypothetical protein